MKEGQRLYECAGTPGYLAPEVLEAGMCEQNECPGYSFEVDAWACGVVMYTLLVGNYFHIMYCIVRDPSKLCWQYFSLF